MIKRRILITGATGFVGRQVCKALADRHTELQFVVRKGKEDQLLSFANAKIISTTDLFTEKPEWWVEQCNGVDTIIHAAWYAEPSMCLQSERNIQCLQGSLNLAQGAIEAGVRRFIGVGSCFEYDLSAGILSIGTPLKPSTLYAATKASLYMCLSQKLPMHSVEFAWCRVFYLYGEGEDPRRLAAYVRSKLEKGEPAELTSGKQIRDFLNVAEAGRTIADVALSTQTGPVNICSGVPITVKQLAEQIADEYGRRDLLIFGARADNLVDPPCVIGVSGSQYLGKHQVDE
jgi:nucleoside-diphosphate-sugar epimerase